jgi:hypothetical protein
VKLAGDFQVSNCLGLVGGGLPNAKVYLSYDVIRFQSASMAVALADPIGGRAVFQIRRAIANSKCGIRVALRGSRLCPNLGLQESAQLWPILH